MLPCIKREREAQWLPSLRRTMVIWSPGAAGRGLQFYACASARGIGDISSTESGFKSSISSASHMTKSAMAVSSEARVTEAPMAVRAGTVNRTVAGSSPAAGAIEKPSTETLRVFAFSRSSRTCAPMHRMRRRVHASACHTMRILMVFKMVWQGTETRTIPNHCKMAVL